MGKASIELVRIDEWTGLYIDGDLKIEGHSLSAREIFEAMEDAGLMDYMEFKETWFDDTPLEKSMLEDGTGFPQKRWNIKET